MQNALHKAIEGGYEPFKTMNMEYATKSDCYGNEFVVESGSGLPYRKKFEVILLDPLFWQCLGKELGWDIKINQGTGHFQGWKWHWHKFIDHIADGGDVDEFFNTLLK